MGTNEVGLPPNDYNPLAWITGDPQIGEGTWIGAFATLDGSGGLRIGRGCDIGTCTGIYTHSTAKRCVSAREYNVVDRAPVTIGDYVFIGPNVYIQMGVTIGDRAAILPGSVVTSDVPANTVVAGVPARPRASVHVHNGQVSFTPLEDTDELS